MQLGWQMVIPATGCVQEEGYLAATVEGLVRPHHISMKMKDPQMLEKGPKPETLTVSFPIDAACQL